MNAPSQTNGPVSVVIPCHDAGAWLATAIRSALEARLVTEVIVVDDHSTDNSVRDLPSELRDRVSLLQSSGRGGNRARNTGLAAAAGEWVQFLDADDCLEPDKIAGQLAESHAGADVLYSPVMVETWMDGTVVGREVTPMDQGTDLPTRWINWQLPQTGGALWRRESLLRIGGWKEDQPCCQEHELYLRAMRSGLRFHFCPTPGAVYRIWSEQTVCRRDPVQVIREKTLLIDRMVDWLRADNRLEDGHLAAAGRVCFEMARTWAVHDLAAADAYQAGRRERGLFRPTGPAAPASYRAILRILGFRRAERLANLLRN